MDSKKIAIPVESPDGLTAGRSDHFGHTKMFALVELNGDVIDKVSNFANKSHDAGGCMSVVRHLQNHDVDTVITSGMGGGPFRGLQNAGIDVLFADRTEFPDVQSVIEALLANRLIPMQMQQLCQGGGNCHQ